MKTKEELNALKNEVKNLNKKLAELTEDELAQVSGGVVNLGGLLHLRVIETDAISFIVGPETTFSD